MNWYKIQHKAYSSSIWKNYLGADGRPWLIQGENDVKEFIKLIKTSHKKFFTQEFRYILLSEEDLIQYRLDDELNLRKVVGELIMVILQEDFKQAKEIVKKSFFLDFRNGYPLAYKHGESL